MKCWSHQDQHVTSITLVEKRELNRISAASYRPPIVFTETFHKSTDNMNSFGL